jgi:phage-related minor tail protein
MPDPTEIVVTGTDQTASLWASLRQQLRSIVTDSGTSGGAAGAGFADGMGTELDALRARFAQSGTESGSAFANGIRGTGDDAAGALGDSGREAGRAFARGADRGINPAVGDAIGDAGDQAPDEGRSAGREYGKAMAAAAAGAVAAAGAIVATSLATSMDMESGVAMLKAQLRLTTEQAAAAGEAAGKVYKTGIVDNLDIVRESIKAIGMEMPSAMSDGSEAIAGMSIQLLNLNKAFDADMPAAIGAARKLVKTGLAPDFQSAMDLITTGFQSGLDTSGDFLDSLNEYTPQFKKLGLSGADAISYMSAAMQAGAMNTDVVADAFKELSLTTIVKSKEMSATYKDLGLDADKMYKSLSEGGPKARQATLDIIDALLGMKDPIAQNDAGIQTFGTQWEDTLRGVVTSFDGLDTSMLDSEGATKRLGDTLENTRATKVQAFRNELDLWMAKLTESTGPLGGLMTALQGFGTEGMMAVTAISAAATAMLALSTSGAAAAMWAGIAATATGIWATAQWGLNLAMSMNPIALFILVLVGLVAAITVAYQNSQTFRDIVSGAMRAVGSAFRAMRDWGIDAVNWLRRKWDEMIQFLSQRPNFAGFWDGLGSSFRGMINWIIGKWNSISFDIPSVDVPGLGRVGGGSVGMRQIPYMASGGVASGGLTMVGERGPELVRLGAGSTVSNAGQTRAALQGQDSPAEITLRIDSGGTKLDQLLVEVLRKSIRVSGGNVQTVLGA